MDDDDIVVIDPAPIDWPALSVGDSFHIDIRDDDEAEEMSVTEDHVAGRTYRKEFRDAFDRTSDDGASVGEFTTDFIG